LNNHYSLVTHILSRIIVQLETRYIAFHAGCNEEVFSPKPWKKIWHWCKNFL